MAVNQQPMSQSITLPTTNVSTGSGFSQLASATSSLSQALTERINDVAISQAAIQGEADVQNDAQPESLALPFTKATKAYNQAVSDTEARRMVASAENLINESLVNNKNPATFNRDTPARFHSEIEGIKSGILEHARDENREQIREHLDKMTAHASLNMLQHSIQYDNQQTKFDMQKDISGLLEARRNAAVAGDTDRLAGIDAAIQASVSDYSTMNAEIAHIAPYLQADIDKSKAVDTVLMGYSDALQNKSTAAYLSDLAENKNKLPFNVWQDSVKAVVALDQTEKRLKNDVNAEQVAQVNLGISNGSIQDASDILNYTELTVPQQLTAMKQLNAAQAQKVKDNSKVITAQQNILSGRPEWNTADTKNAMFKNSIQQLEQATGQPATLQQMEASIMGTSHYPASGMSNTPMGTNVPAFDSVLQGKLESGDIVATAQAAMVFNDIVNIKDKPGVVNLSGDGLAVASLFNELYQGGTTPEQAAEQSINSVINAKEPEIAQRVDRFNKTLAHVNPRTGQNALAGKFKDAFGSAPQSFLSDQAFKLFTDIYKANYISSNSEEGAFKATKYAMQKWGTSEYFDKGYVGQPVPEKEIPITKIGNAFGNQIVSTLQVFIDRNNAMRAEHPELGIPLVEWASPDQELTGNISEQDKVFKKFTVGNKPRLKINGHETDVVLMPSASSRLDNRINYLFGVYDQFNNLNPLKDVSNGVDQVARFAPTELSIWAPGVATAQVDKEIRDLAMSVESKEIKKVDKKELAELERKAPAWQTILGLGGLEEHRAYIERRAGRTDKGRIEKIIQSIKSAGSAETRGDITAADNVGISPDLINEGNIDLNTRPRVKRANGKTSTVDSIGIEEDGKHYVIPQISDDGEVLTAKEAIDLFHKTGKHLGVFKTRKAADKFAQKLHESEAKKLKGNE